MITSPSTRRTWTAAAALAAVLALAACGDPTGPLPREGAPQELRFSIGGYGVGSSLVELRGDTLTLRRIPWDWRPGTPLDTVRVVPTADAWRAFWTAAEGSGVRRWRERYVAEGIADGVGWGLRITAGRLRIRSEGSNAYPDRRGREHENEMTHDFLALLAAVGEMVGEPLL